MKRYYRIVSRALIMTGMDTLAREGSQPHEYEMAQGPDRV
jgi:hypothetical protein